MIETLTKREWDPEKNLWALNADFWKDENGGHILRLVVNSGSPGCQHFRTIANEKIGQYEPIPEGIYTPGPLEFASGVPFDYSQRFPEIDSPIWQVIYRSRAIGKHLDGNRAWAPGSAGCEVFRSMADLKAFCELFRKDMYRLKKEYVYWGLGSYKLPPALAEKLKDPMKKPV